MELVYDSGMEIANKTVSFYPLLFNSDYIEQNTIARSADSRSDNKVCVNDYIYSEVPIKILVK